MHDCSGLMGKLFGHKFTPIYDEDVEKRSAQEIAVILHNVHEHNKWAYLQNTVKPDLNQNKRTTKVFKGLYCSRCGTTIDDPFKM